MNVERRAVLRAAAVAAAAGLAVWTGRALLGPRATRNASLTLRVRVPWTGWSRDVLVADQAVLQAVGRARRTPARAAGAPPPDALPVWEAEVDWREGGRATFMLLEGGLVQDGRSGHLLDGGPLRDGLVRAVRSASEQLFGELVPWPDVHPLFPAGTEVAIEDLRTGSWFRVQRYGGEHHADVEPVSRADTETLRRLFGGEWSWSRRPVVVHLLDRRLAASINGMPHGHGFVADNDFPGHFCLHFLGSRVHASGRIDPSHQLMVQEAAGRLPQALREAPAEQLVLWAFAAIQEDDPGALAFMLSASDAAHASELTRAIRYVTPIRVAAAPPDIQAPATPVVEVDLIVYYTHPNPDAGYRVDLRIPLEARARGSGYQLAAGSLEPLLKVPASRQPFLRSGGIPGC